MRENRIAALGPETPPGPVALMVWGDPALYDSTLRIARRLTPCPRLRVVPGITAVQALTAAHAIPLNTVALISPASIIFLNMRPDFLQEGAGRPLIRLFYKGARVGSLNPHVSFMKESGGPYGYWGRDFLLRSTYPRGDTSCRAAKLIQIKEFPCHPL